MLKKNIKNKEAGHYFIETAIIIPIFLVSIFALGMLIRYFGIDFRVSNILKDEVYLSSQRAYILKVDPFLKSRIKNRLSENQTNLNIERLYCIQGITKGGYDNLISSKLTYNIDFSAPFQKEVRDKRSVKALSRKFIGDKKNKDTISFDDMEKEGETDIVYVFTNDGIRYHRSTCRTVDPKYEVVTLSESIKNDYEPCQICNAKKIEDGANVYIFLGYGKTYHKSNCTIVNKNIEKLKRNVAKDRGYSECKICNP